MLEKPFLKSQFSGSKIPDNEKCQSPHTNLIAKDNNLKRSSEGEYCSPISHCGVSPERATLFGGFGLAESIFVEAKSDEVNLV